nr:NBS-LRR disease resistance protein [Dasypyrum villosum]
MAVVSSSLGVLGPLLGKLTGLLAGECARLKGVRREIRSLRSELTCMHAAVQKCTMLQDPDVQVKAWISLLRELAYDIEDVIDKFIHQLGNGGIHQGGFKEFFRKTARRLKTLGSRRGIAHQIDDIKIRLKEVKELKSSYMLDDISCEHSAVDPRLSALFVEEAHLVGIDDPRDDLANWMLEDENTLTKQRKVLSIVGFGGLGKTTLAREVYRKIQGHFHCQAFVSVSQKPNVRKIMKDLISQVPRKDDFAEGIDTWDEAKCIAKLKELLQDKRYLIVIDDIWSISAWDTIKYAFPENDLSSKIIATKRNVDVARSCCQGGNGRMYEMEALSDLDSKMLFFKRIFGSEDCCPDVLKQISNKILKKCGGLPLATISISSLLANRPVVKDEWERVRRSIGSALDKNRNLDGMNSILSLSYNDLSPNLKTCLLYLCIYPEDYVIERDILVRRWIAEGFISEERGQSKQEVAENHFYELINKSMVQLVEVGYDGKARACKVHDMMLELIISKSCEENFISLAGHDQTDLANCHGIIRRLSLQHIDQELTSILENEDLSHVRSLTVIASTCIKHLPRLVGFEALRVLEFQDCENLHEYDMNGIHKLVQLKYLSFRGTDMLKLPSGVVRLYGLETLDLRDTLIEELPAGIIQLVKLQHLLTARYPYSSAAHGETKIPNGIGTMMNLQAISGFNIIKSSLCTVEELGNLTNLKELHLQLDGGGSQAYKRHEDMLLSSLCKLGTRKLQSLWIHSPDSTPLQFLDSWSPLPYNLQICRMTTKYDLPKMPEWIVPALTSLAYLNINLIEATEKDLQILGEMPALLRLSITTKTVQKERLTVQGVVFLCLKEFCLTLATWCESAIYLTFKEGAMPKVEKLELPLFVLVAQVYGFYLGLGHLPRLRDVEVNLWSGAGASAESNSAAADAIRREANSHPNHPKLSIQMDKSFFDTRMWMSSEDESYSDEEDSYSDVGIMIS